MKKILLVMIVALALIAAAADAWLRSFAEDRAADRVTELLDLDGNPKVTLDGWPFIVRLLAGNFPSVTMSAQGIETRAGVRLRGIRIKMEDVEFEAGKLLAGDADAIRADRGQGVATVTEDGLRGLAGDRYPQLRLSIRGGRIRVSSPRLPDRARGIVSLRDGDSLVVEVKGLPEDLVVPLPELVEGITYESLSVLDRAILVRFRLEDARLVSGE